MTVLGKKVQHITVLIDLGNLRLGWGMLNNTGLNSVSYVLPTQFPSDLGLL